jgi:uncharacterized protein
VSELESLCLSCGLCCNGSFFRRVPLTPEEAARAGASHLTQPCVLLKDTCCAAYAQRPLACRRFECLLFSALKGKEVTLSGAQQIVEQMKQKLHEDRLRIQSGEVENESQQAAGFQRHYFGRFF